MAIKSVKAVLWRRVNKSNVDSLTGRSAGQYDIRMGKQPWIAQFFEGLPQQEPTANGGFTLPVLIQPFEGESPIPATVLNVRYMGDQSERQDWNIPAQRPTTAYPLWREGRGVPTAHVYSDNDRNYILVIRDVDDQFHARWLNEERLENLPIALRDAIAANTDGVFTSVTVSSLAQDIIARLKRHFNVLLYGPPGTGKTHLIQEVTSAMTTSSCLQIDTASEDRPLLALGASNENIKSAWATFHQSYSYEDFIISLRPEPSETMMMNLVPTPGLLLELSEFARRPKKSSLLVIDEVNRGNTSRIFGEFITLLEPDKRLDDNGDETPSTVKIRLPYVRSGQQVQVAEGDQLFDVPNPFTLPLRLYTLATMNSVDKSVAPLDSALRRRFEVVDLGVNFEALLDAMEIDENLNDEARALPSPIGEADDLKRLAIRFLQRINQRLSFYVGREYCLGQWYLASLIGADALADAQTAVQEIWDAKVLPQLEELFRSRSDQLVSVLQLDTFDNPGSAPIYLDEPSESLIELGAGPVLCRRDIPFSMFESFLRHVANVSILPPAEANTTVETAQPPLASDSAETPPTENA